MTRPMKFYTYVTVVALIAFGSTVRAGLVAYWDFEEGSGATTKDQISGNDDPLTDTTWVTDVAPFPGTTAALEFNGSTSVIDTAYEGVGGDNPRSITAWVKLAEVTETAASQSLVTYGGRDTNGQKWHFRINDGGDPRVRGAIRTEAQGGNQTGTTNIADGQWHHVASVFPGGAGSDNTDVIHYVDGILEGETGTTDEPINTGIGGTFPRVSIGARRQDANSGVDAPLSSYLNGILDEVRIYDHALTQEEVRALAIPEPATMLLAALGLLSLFAGRRRVFSA